MSNYFIKLTRESGEVIHVNASLIAAMGTVPRGSIVERAMGNGPVVTFLRLDGALDHVRETPEEIFSLMSDKA
jgi:uncharacterized protein YlzI (FlbEa/FlbD family)